MNPPLPTVTARQVARAAEKLGFRFDRQRGATPFTSEVQTGAAS